MIENKENCVSLVFSRDLNENRSFLLISLNYSHHLFLTHIDFMTIKSQIRNEIRFRTAYKINIQHRDFFKIKVDTFSMIQHTILKLSRVFFYCFHDVYDA